MQHRASTVSRLCWLPAFGYAAAVAVAVVAALLTHFVPGPLGGPLLFLLVPAVAGLALLAGTGPGLLASGLSAAALVGQVSPDKVLQSLGFFIASVLTVGIAGAHTVRWYGTGTDIDDRQRAEAALRRSEELNRRLIDSSLDCIKVLDLQGNLLSMSTGGQLLLEIPDLRPYLNNCWLDFWKTEDRREVAEAVAAARAGAMGHFQAFCPSAAGTPKWWDVLITPINGDDGRVEHLLAVSRDVTKQKLAELERERLLAALEDRDRRKDDFLAILSHELRNPLAPISNSLRVLDRAAAGSDQARRARAIIERQVRHMTRLVEDLLDVSRITRGKIQLQRERLDLRSVMERTLEDHRPGFMARDIMLHAGLPPQPVWVDGDATRLAQVIGNLLQNAAKFTRTGGRVEVELGQEGQTAVVRVRDTGVGIAPDMLARIFQPFAQSDLTLDRSSGGLGLGLALVKGLIELHGGQVQARSAGPDQGTELTVRLPAEHAIVLSERPELRGVKPPARRVLIIEDNVDAAESLREVLEIDEHEVAVAFTGPEGLEKACSFAPDVVLCDIGLPGMDGYEVARAFRANGTLRDITLVALTGYALMEDTRKALEAGFDRHLAKPPALEELEGILAELPKHRAS